jgi:hypothetical protein
VKFYQIVGYTITTSLWTLEKIAPVYYHEKASNFFRQVPAFVLPCLHRLIRIHNPYVSFDLSEVILWQLPCLLVPYLHFLISSNCFRAGQRPCLPGPNLHPLFFAMLAYAPSVIWYDCMTKTSSN